MKALALIALITAAQSTMAADLAAFKAVLASKQVEELATKLAKQGFKLDEVNDGTKGTPRCQCADIKLKFVKTGDPTVPSEKKKYIARVEGVGYTTVTLTVAPEKRE